MEVKLSGSLPSFKTDLHFSSLPGIPVTVSFYLNVIELMINPAIILVRPQISQNIGTTARAMLNFGLTDLRLVAPKQDWKNKNARALAAGADVILENARVFDSVPDAIADLQGLYATTARPRDVIKEVKTPVQAASEIVTRIQDSKKIGILFGAESCGLENEEIVLADTIISVPLNRDFSSLNLAQAVILVAYEVYQAAAKEGSPERPAMDDSEEATRQEFVDFLEHLEGELDQSGYFRTAHKRKIMAQNLRNMFSRVPFTSQEIRTLRGVIASLVNPKEDSPRGKKG